MKEPLEELEEIEEETGLAKLVSTVKTQAKEYAVDTSAILLSGNLIYGLNEYFTGMDSEEVIKTRIGMSFIGLFTSRPYAKFREYWAKRCKADAESSRIKKFLTDVSSTIAFYTPIYMATMYVSGASVREIGIATATGTAIALGFARPQCWFLDKWRKLFGVKPTLDTYVEKESSD